MVEKLPGINLLHSGLMKCRFITGMAKTSKCHDLWMFEPGGSLLIHVSIPKCFNKYKKRENMYWKYIFIIIWRFWKLTVFILNRLWKDKHRTMLTIRLEDGINIYLKTWNENSVMRLICLFSMEGCWGIPKTYNIWSKNSSFFING